MELLDAIKKNDVITVESIIKQHLKLEPRNIDLWLKLSLTELQYPLEDYECALQFIEKIFSLSSENIDALILKASIQWHSFGIIDGKLNTILTNIKNANNEKQAIIKYLISLHYRCKKDFENEELFLKESITLCNKFVYPYEALGRILLNKNKAGESQTMFRIALSNIEKVYKVDDWYDFTDINTYIAEFITGTAISTVNYESIKKLAQK